MKVVDADAFNEMSSLLDECGLARARQTNNDRQRADTHSPLLRLTLIRSNSNLERLVIRLHFIQLFYARQLLRTLSSPPDPLSFGRRFGHGDGAAFLADRPAQADAGETFSV